MELIYFLNDAIKNCTDPGMVAMTTAIGYVVLGIKIVAPIVLLVVGMIDMTKAIAGKDEDTIKKAQKALGKKAIAAVVVFLIATMVGLLMGLVGGEDFKACSACINDPFRSADPKCGITSDLPGPEVKK